MPSKTFLIGAVLVTAVLSTSLFSFSGGALPGGVIPIDAARAAPSCSVCHRVSGSRPRVTVTPDKLLLAPGENISIATSHRAGVSGAGGFVSEVTAGQFTAGPRTTTSSNGNFVTHTSRSNNWEYGYTAPNTPGLVELFTVVNSVNGNGSTGGDAYGLRGFQTSDTVSTPVRMYVMARGVEPVGEGCTDGFNHQAVIGAAEVPSVGNANFGVELVGAAPETVAGLMVGINGPGFQPVDLAMYGVDDCTLYVEDPFVVHLKTSAGLARRGEGSGFFSIPVPNLPTLAGIGVDMQVAYIDISATIFRKRSTAITLTNALHVVIQ